MKLVIQIPCYNEGKTIQQTINSLPKKIAGIDEIEVLIIDDGSSDDTVEAAKASGVTNFVLHKRNKGLAQAFVSGLDKSLSMGADVIVNTDGDNQYCADDIEKLIAPILENKADIVIGSRPVSQIKNFSFIKKILNKFGSLVMRLISMTSVQDAPSGFRAFSSNAASQLNVFDKYTYTMETIIQAGAKGLRIMDIPIRVNPQTRNSRLVKNNIDYVLKSAFTMIRMFVIYRPFRFFISVASVFAMLGIGIGLRFMYFYFSTGGNGHIQSLILASILIIIGFQIGMLAFVSELLAINRKLSEDIQVRLKRLEKDKKF